MIALDDALVAVADYLDAINAVRSEDGARTLLEYGADPDAVVEWRLAADVVWHVWRAETLSQLRAELLAWLSPPTVH